MGTRYIFDGIPCKYCNEINNDVYYAPSSQMTSFICKCGTRNEISDIFLYNTAMADLQDEYREDDAENN